LTPAFQRGPEPPQDRRLSDRICRGPCVQGEFGVVETGCSQQLPVSRRSTDDQYMGVPWRDVLIPDNVVASDGLTAEVGGVVEIPLLLHCRYRTFLPG